MLGGGSQSAESVLAFHAVASEMRFTFAVRSTEATPTKHTNGFRLILAMPAFHSVVLLGSTIIIQQAVRMLKHANSAPKLPRPFHSRINALQHHSVNAEN